MNWRKWMPTIVAGGLGGALWLVAALDGYGLEMLWLPAVAVGAAWPPTPGRVRDCVGRLRRRERASS